ncbi:MAG: TlpA disulfide reductase family protein [Bacteroidales bacterium]
MKLFKSLAALMLALLIGATTFAQDNTLKAGEQTPDFTYQDINDKSYSLADFTGKYIFLDMWATWCGPCNKEIPFIKTLEGKMHGKNIVFVSLSVDKDKDKWVEFIKSHKMTGIQLHNGGDRSLSDVFDVKFIPRFIIIGPDGKVVNPAAERPSNGEILFEYLQALPEM